MSESIEASKVEIAPVEPVGGSRGGEQDIESLDVVEFAVGDVDASGMLPRRLSRVWSLTAARSRSKRAHGQRLNPRSMMLASSA